MQIAFSWLVNQSRLQHFYYDFITKINLIHFSLNCRKAPLMLVTTMSLVDIRMRYLLHVPNQ